MVESYAQLAERIVRGGYVSCRVCATSLSLGQLRDQSRLCDQHWESLQRRGMAEKMRAEGETA